MDFTLTKEELLIQKMARDFSNQSIQPHVERMEKENRTFEEIISGLADLDMFAMIIPEQFGGAGAGYISYVLALEQIARVACGPAFIISAHNLALSSIINFGTEEQKAKYLSKTARGEHIASFAFTESATGSDPKQLTTVAVKDGGGYVLNGAKRFISNASYPGPLVLFALDSESKKPTAFIVEKKCSGYSVSEPWKKLGWHGGDLVDIYLKDVKIPAENVLGQLGNGYPILQYGMAYGKIGMNSIALGTTLAALEEGVKYAKEKTHRGEPIAKFQAIQLKVAELCALYESSRWLTYRLGFLAANNNDYKNFAKEAALAKFTVARNAQEAARLCLDIHGSYGLMEEYAASRIYRDAAMGPQIEGVLHLQEIIIASSVLS
ncbi:MAG: acyl-CoA dehydrogenase family protein [Syntrophomonadaceae bacterium]|jgi:alkylation response protein AidB-like acyl-CoA dehydrogenase|nr:acyl-CoA dehydrogenase family protein [Syntrophomonadaceae bacterium]